MPIFYNKSSGSTNTLKDGGRELSLASRFSSIEELTKIYEEFKTGTPSEILEYFNKNKDKQRGKFTVIVA